MAQTEDTELRDLVIEALEKNGSLAKIRALLRANVFLVFEDEGQNMKQNVSLDTILKHPEGAVCLSIIHEFLEFCNLKNTLFVYMTESRQGTEYIYEGQKKLADKLNISRSENTKEPILMSLLRQAMKTNQRKNFDQSNTHNLKNHDKPEDNNFNEQNCTYIVHEDSSSNATSNSQSDNSSDEKNKLHLRLQLDNSDTDTSSDSARDKFSSEYIPSEHVIESTDNDPCPITENKLSHNSQEIRHIKQSPIYEDKINDASYLQEGKVINNSSSESTSYLDLKPYDSYNEKLFNTTGVPITEPKEQTNQTAKIKEVFFKLLNDNATNIDSVSKVLSSVSLKNEETDRSAKNSIEDPGKSEAETPEYSNDFTSSPDHKNIDLTENSPKQIEDIYKEEVKGPKNSSFESPRQSSQSSVSSISISDVADLISERSCSFSNQNHDINCTEAKISNYSSKKLINNKSKQDNIDNCPEFSESPVPSLSNLSLDIHSD